MRLLLDTHVLVWWLVDDEQLGASTRSRIAGAERVMVSAATPWELEIKRSLGKIELDDGYLEGIVESGFEALPITLAHAVAAGRLPQLHRDPFDRMLVAQARIEGLSLVSADAAVMLYDVEVIDPRS